MSHYKFVRVNSIFLTAALVLLLPVLAAAQAVTTQLTATEVFDPMNLFGSGSVGAYTNPGMLTCPGAEPTGNPVQPCPPGSRIHLRGVSGKSKMISQSAMFGGWMYFEMNVNLDAAGAGRAWGEFRLELDAGGVWEGSWTDDRNRVDDLNVWAGRGLFIGHGTSGSVEGMQLRFTETASTFTLLPLAWAGSVDAEILAPPSQ